MAGRYKERVDRSWSRNLAYAIGLITADGCLNKDGRHIYFVSKDLEMVENLKVAIKIDNKIFKHHRADEKEKKYYAISFGDVMFYRFLNQIGLTSAKSKTIESVIVPTIYFNDFLRGLFDGDGTFYTFWDKRWPNSFGYKIAFASASPTFIKWLRARLKKHHGVKGYLHKGAGVLNLEYAKADSIRLSCAMYKDKEESLFLARKYNKIMDALRFDKNRQCRGSSMVERSPEERYTGVRFTPAAQ